MIALLAVCQDAAEAVTSGVVDGSVSATGGPEGADSFLFGLALIFMASGLIAAPLIRGWFTTKLPLERVFFARWGFTHVVAVMLAWFCGAALIGVVVGLEWIVPEGFLMELLLGSTPLLVACGFGGYYAHKLHPEGLSALGLRFDGRALTSMVMGWLSYWFVLPTIFGVGLVWMRVAPYLGIEYESQAVLKAAMELEGTNRLLGLLLIAGLIPLLEEWLFRGFLQPLLIQNLREKGGIALTSFGFAILHGPSAFAPVFCLSVFLGYVQLRSHRLPAAWLIHATHNGSVLLLIWLVPDTAEILR